MVALASPALIRHDLEGMHGLVMGLLLEARHHTPTTILAESLAGECRAFIRHLLHAGVPDQIDHLADAACDLFEQGSARMLSDATRAAVRASLQRACSRMRAQQGREPAPITHIMAIGKLAATLPRLRSCTPAHLETLAAPTTRLLLYLFG
jgi:hypothetical protein